MNTKEKLARSFKELATQKDVDKVTIGEIADHAGVMRATFYNHFKDKYNLDTKTTDNKLKLESKGYNFSKELDRRILSGEFRTIDETDSLFCRYDV